MTVPEEKVGIHEYGMGIWNLPAAERDLFHPRGYDPVIAAEMHQAEKVQQSIVIRIEITVGIGLELCLPYGIHKYPAFCLCSYDTRRSRRGH